MELLERTAGVSAGGSAPGDTARLVGSLAGRYPFIRILEKEKLVPERLLTVPAEFDPTTQTFVGVVFASLDDQSRRLRDVVAGLSVEHLEWQERPGRNTVGMLLAHLAGAEIGWFRIVCGGLTEDEGARVIEDCLGIDLATDRGGMPLAADGVHPASLKGRDLAGYVDLLTRARAATQEVLTGWHDADLHATVSFGPLTVSRRWVLYHVLEHFASHVGQILMLVHCMRDNGVSGLPETRPVGL